jgi:hypothetical protein
LGAPRVLQPMACRAALEVLPQRVHHGRAAHLKRGALNAWPRAKSRTTRAFGTHLG